MTRARLLTFACCLLLPMLAHAQSVNIDLGAAGAAGATGRLVQITALVTVLSLACRSSNVSHNPRMPTSPVWRLPLAVSPRKPF